MLVEFVIKGWGKPLIAGSWPLFPVFETWFSVTQPASPGPAVSQAVLMFFHFVSEEVSLLVDILMLPGTYGYPDMLVAGITFVLYRLCISVFSFC